MSLEMTESEIEAKYEDILAKIVSKASLPHISKMSEWELENIGTPKTVTHLKVKAKGGKTYLPDIRTPILNGLLYDRLSELDDSIIQTIEATVIDPLLEKAIPEKDKPRSAFINDFSPDMWSSNHFICLSWYMRSLTLLDILIENPELAEGLKPSSSNMPSSLLSYAKKMRLKDAQGQIADAIIEYYPNMFSEQIEIIERSFTSTKNETKIRTVNSHGKIWLGKRYVKPTGPYLRWDLEENSQEAESRKIEELDSIITNDLKKAIYITLLRDLRVCSEFMKETGQSPSQLKSTGMGLSKKDYWIARKNIYAYTINSLLIPWQESIESGNLVVPSPTIAKMQGLKIVTADNEKLVFYDRTTNQTRHLYPHSHPLNSTSYFPYCTLLVANLHKAAKAYHKSQ